jgi:hypothetical protein
MLSLDLSRLKGVASRLGCGAPGGFGTREQLRRINRALGEKLAGCSDGERSTMAQAFVEVDAVLPAEIARPPGEPLDVPGLDTLRQKGCLGLGQPLDGEQAAEIERYLRSRPLLVGRMPGRPEGQAQSLETVPADRNFACHSYLDLWSSPHVVEFAARDTILDLAQAYLGCAPTLYSLNAYWALPERLADPQVQAFHRDIEDCRSLAILTSLTPVDTPDEGARYYVESSHDVPRLEASLRAEGVGTKIDYLLAGPFVAPMTMRLFGRTAKRFHGPAGSSLCIDPYGLHRTVVPRSRPQLLLDLRFGTFMNERIHDMELIGDRGLQRTLRKALAPVFQLGAGFSRSRRAQARQILQRIPGRARQRYAFRYLIQALSAGL